MSMYRGFFGTKIFNIQNLRKIVLLILDGVKNCLKSGEKRVILFLTIFFKVTNFIFIFLLRLCHKFQD